MISILWSVIAHWENLFVAWIYFLLPVTFAASHYGTLVNFILQIYHSENKFKPLKLLSIMNTWNTGGHDTVSTSVYENNETGSLHCFISEISEGVSSQLHSSIMKAARRVVLDEIISNIIGEFFTARKAERRLKHESVNHAAQSFPLKGTAVIYSIAEQDTDDVFFFSCLII